MKPCPKRGVTSAQNQSPDQDAVCEVRMIMLPVLLSRMRIRVIFHVIGLTRPVCLTVQLAAGEQ